VVALLDPARADERDEAEERTDDHPTECDRPDEHLGEVRAEPIQPDVRQHMT
jgi:hypothetical protein